MLSPPLTPFLKQYETLVSSGAIEPDAAQRELAVAFGDLEQRVERYRPFRRQRLLGRLFADKSEGPPRGLYVHGEVGRGKTMLMDLFFQESPVRYKRRAHFHEFMTEVHERIYGFRQQIARGEIPDGEVIALTATASRRGCCALTNSTSPISRMP
jgi:cell division protein ZapE